MLVQAVVENSHFELKLKGAIKKGFNGIDYVEGFERIVDYNTIEKDEMYGVVDKIRKSGSYDIVIIDLNSTLDSVAQAVFEQADSIVVTEKASDLGARKMEMFAQQAIASEYRNKMYRISNFADGNSQFSRALNVESLGSIHNYGTQNLKDLVQIIMKKEAINISVLTK